MQYRKSWVSHEKCLYDLYPAIEKRSCLWGKSKGVVKPHTISQQTICNRPKLMTKDIYPGPDSQCFVNHLHTCTEPTWTEKWEYYQNCIFSILLQENQMNGGRINLTPSSLLPPCRMFIREWWTQQKALKIKVLPRRSGRGLNLPRFFSTYFFVVILLRVAFTCSCCQIRQSS